MHECRKHSNLWGKMVLWGDKALETDHFGYYSGKVPVYGVPSQVDYHEEYPHMVSAWMYDHQYLDAEFDYGDLELDYLNQQAGQAETAQEARAKIEESRR